MFILVAEWIHCTLLGILLPTRKKNSATKTFRGLPQPWILKQGEIFGVKVGSSIRVPLRNITWGL